MNSIKKLCHECSALYGLGEPDGIAITQDVDECDIAHYDSEAPPTLAGWLLMGTYWPTYQLELDIYE